MSAERSVATALVVVLLALAPAACKRAEAIEQEHYQPSRITAVKEGEHPTVTLTKLAAERISLETAPVQTSNGRTTIPYESMLYDAHGGQAYVYVNTKGLSFVRADVTVEDIDGGTVVVSMAPAPGTRIVTVGLPQIHGAELEFGAY
jgi:hypothetical protein